MKKEIQQIKIAEATGWKLADVQFSDNVWYRHAEKKEVCERQDLPDYLNDLNAMQQALGVIVDPILQIRYAANLLMVLGHVDLYDAYDLNVDYCWNAINASAAQHAEALLKTLNLWEEEQ